MNTQLLSKEEEQGLARQWKEKGDEKALHRLVQAHSPLAVSAALKRRRSGVPVDDLIQSAYIGLLEAAQRFDPEKGFRFATYADFWLKCVLQDQVLGDYSLVRIGKTKAGKALFFNFRRLKQEAESAKGTGSFDDSDREAIAKKLNVRLKDVIAFESRIQRDMSLNCPLPNADGEEGLEPINCLTDSAPTPEESVLDTHTKTARSKWLKAALETLSPRENIIIKKRFLVEKDQVVTLKELSADLGISKERIRQIEKTALNKMKRHPSSSYGETSL